LVLGKDKAVVIASAVKDVEYLHVISHDTIENVVGADDTPPYPAVLVARYQRIAQSPITELVIG